MKMLAPVLAWMFLVVGCSHPVEQTIIYPDSPKRAVTAKPMEAAAVVSAPTTSASVSAAAAVQPLVTVGEGGLKVAFRAWDRFQVAGGTVHFGSKGEAPGGVRYQWQFDGQDIPGATNAVLGLINVTTRHEGRYRVVVANDLGTVTSAESRFRLLPPPTLVSKFPEPELEVPYQSDVSLGVVVEAPGQTNGFPLHYRWSHNGTNLTIYNLPAPNPPTHTFPANADSTYSLVVSNAAGSVSNEWKVRVRFNTLSYEIATNLAARTRGRSGSLADMRLVTGWGYQFYTATNLHLLSGVRWSTNCWLSGVQGLTATPISMSNNLAGQTMLTMVSPRHYVSATHIGVGHRGVTLAFLDRDNRLHWRRILKETALNDDVSVGILDQDLPPSVGFLPVLPPDFNDYLPRHPHTPVQGIGQNQDLCVFTHSLMLDDRQSVWWNLEKAVPFGAGTNWNVRVRGGDSSLPVRLLLRDQLVLVTQYHTAQSGPMLATRHEAINRAMRALSVEQRLKSDYQLTPFSLAAWPKLHGKRAR